jgi:uncharacterized protein (TIGR03790 family)
MRQNVFRTALILGILVIAWSTPLRSHAGGSGLNTVVVVNQNSSNSRELANYYCERRQVPPENVLRISWTGNNILWTASEFQSVLLNPLLAMLAARGLTNQIDFVVLSMDIPFQTDNNSFINSTTSALFYDLQTSSTINGYANSELIFRKLRPLPLFGDSFLTTMITGDSLAAAKQVVDQGVDSDETFPGNPVILARTSDSLRNVRYTEFDHAIFDSRIRGHCMVVRTNSDSPAGQSNLFGYQTGLASFSVSPGTFVPGSIADSMTSYGGVIFGPNSQTSLLAFLNAGAAGSYGTVTEPYIDPQKFPDPEVYFYQSRGFSLAESYYQSIIVPFQGLIVGEPLAAPYSRRGVGQWVGITSNSTLSGTTPLTLQFSAFDPKHPLQQVDLFVDGKYSRTLTNLPPQQGNVVSIRLKNLTLPYTIPANASIALVATQLVSLINLPANTNATGVAASLHGDRIELRVLATNRPAPPTSVNLTSNQVVSFAAATTSFVSSSVGTASFLSTFPVASRDSFLSSPIPAMKSCVTSGTLQVGNWMRIRVTKNGGSQVTVGATNQVAGATIFDLATQLAAAVNSSAGLQDLNGVVVEGVTRALATTATFEIRARNTGPRGATIKIHLTGSSNLALSPNTDVPLNENGSEMQPRNHVCITAGATNLNFTFPLDTTAFDDGYHELTAVAYEGSHVRTQTRATIPVRVQNSGLSATIDLLDLPASAPANGTYHIQVTANTNSISSITLFSTGGALTTVAGQSSTTFTINGTTLGAGLHPFHAIVQTTGGRAYRTETHWVRLTN